MNEAKHLISEYHTGNTDFLQMYIPTTVKKTTESNDKYFTKKGSSYK